MNVEGTVKPRYIKSVDQPKTPSIPPDEAIRRTTLGRTIGKRGNEGWGRPCKKCRRCSVLKELKRRYPPT